MRLLAAITACSLTLGVCAALTASAAASPFDGRGMWIWIVSASDGGNASAIASQAQRNGIKTLYIKSGDGVNYWPQFSPALVQRLHAQRLERVRLAVRLRDRPGCRGCSGGTSGGERRRLPGDRCGDPVRGELQRGPTTTSRRCARRLARVSRSACRHFRTSTITRPFPTQCFSGPAGRNTNDLLPEMYWSDIGTSVEAVYQHTYTYNRIYRRPIRPVGQTDNGVERQRHRAVPRAVDRLRCRRTVVVGFRLAGADGVWPALSSPTRERPDRAGGWVSATAIRVRRRHRPVDAGAPGERDPIPADHRPVRVGDARGPACLPG